MEFVNTAKKKLTQKGFWLGPLPAPALNAKKSFSLNKTSIRPINDMDFGLSKKMAVLNWTAVFLFLTDRLLKWLALSGVIWDNSLAGRIFSFSLDKNENMAFSLPFSGWWLNMFIMLILVLILIAIFKFKKRNAWTFTALWFVLMGGISNFIDRIIHGGVVDYISFLNLTVFNLADLMVTLGIFCLIFRPAVFFDNSSKNVN